ncbi:MAG: hypothetical protein SGI97_04985 [candidate division Zixibacteria bacterium]|nr:hypothetical protein [candidate division Zixibacteria bacterium]
MAKQTFDQRADPASLARANRLLAGVERHELVATKSNPREQSTVPNYFLSFKTRENICIANLCLWDNGTVAVEFRHPDFLAPEHLDDTDVKLYGSMSWPQYRYRDHNREAKALRLLSSYLDMIGPAVLARQVAIRGSSKAERSLRNRLKELFPTTSFTYNYRGFDWLGKLELDIVLTGENLAIEVQGEQHFKPVWGEEHLLRITINDSKKAMLCEKNGFSLIRITTAQALRISNEDLKAVVQKAITNKCSLIDIG